MASSTQPGKLQTNAMKANRKQRQYIYHHCQLCHVTRSCAVIVGVCILMLPMLELATEHVQLATMYCMDSINHVHARHMIFSHTHLLPFLRNVLPAMILQNRATCSNIKCLSYSAVGHVSLSPAPTGLGRKVVGVVMFLLLLMSGDIETNPGPVGELMCISGRSKYLYWTLKSTGHWCYIQQLKLSLILLTQLIP